jgi:hypothetical protein
MPAKAKELMRAAERSGFKLARQKAVTPAGCIPTDAPPRYPSIPAPKSAAGFTTKF